MTTRRLQRGLLDLDRGVLFPQDGGAPVPLTPTETLLLAHLAAQGGQPVSKEALQELVWGYRPGVLSRTVFTTVGRVRAKIEVTPRQPDHLVTVPGEGYALRGLESVAATARPSADGIPRAATPLVGRERELAWVDEALRAGARLVTLHGPGGVGKTRLALELLAKGAGASPGAGRLAFVALDGVAEPAGVPAALGEALGLELGEGPDPLGEIALEVGAEPGLVVLDNAEHLVSGLAPLLDRLLRDCPGVQWVATSRLRLGLRAEHLLRVPDLALPNGGEALEAADAGRLMLDAAGRARVGWAPSPAEREALAEVCARVGGSPLAIELAAAWLRVLDPAELLEELADPIEVLASSDPDRPARHRSVAVALEASWRLIGPTAAQALEALGVFVGAFDRRLARAVAGADLSVLAQLMDAAMLQRGPAGFALHPLVRGAARARLEANPERAGAARRRHQDALLERLSQLFTQSLGASGGADTFVAQLRPYKADLVAAWLRAAADGRTATLRDRAAAMVAFLDASHAPAELIAALQGAAERLRASGAEDAQGSEDTRDAEHLAGVLCLLTIGAGARPPADLAAAAGDARTMDGTLGTLALIHVAIGSHMRNQPEPGVAWAAEAAGRADAQPQWTFPRAFARGVWGSLLLRLGRLEAAHTMLTEAAALAGDGPGGARSRVHLGQAQLALGQPEQARETLEAAIAALRQEGDRGFVVMGLTSLADTEAALGHDPTPLLTEAVEESVRSCLPAVWSSGALARLAARRLAGGDASAATQLAAQLDPRMLASTADRAAWEQLQAGLRRRLSEPELGRLTQAGAALDGPALLALLGEAGTPAPR